MIDVSGVNMRSKPKHFHMKSANLPNSFNFK